MQRTRRPSTILNAEVHDDFPPAVTFKFTSLLPPDECAFRLKNRVWKILPTGYKRIQAKVNTHTSEFRVVWYEDSHTIGAEVMGQLRRARGRTTLISGKARMTHNKYPRAWLYGAILGLMVIVAALWMSNAFVLATGLFLTLWMVRALWMARRRHKVLVRAIRKAIASSED